MIEILDMQEEIIKELKEAFKNISTDTRYDLYDIFLYAEEYVQELLAICNKNIETIKQISVDSSNKDNLIQELIENKEYYLTKAEIIREIKSTIRNIANEGQ